MKKHEQKDRRVSTETGDKDQLKKEELKDKPRILTQDEVDKIAGGPEVVNDM